MSELVDIRGGEEWLRRVLTFLDLEQPTDSVCLPTSNVAIGERKSSPGSAASPGALSDLYSPQFLVGTDSGKIYVGDEHNNAF